jgi:hypothetical protein
MIDVQSKSKTHETEGEVYGAGPVPAPLLILIHLTEFYLTLPRNPYTGAMAPNEVSIRVIVRAVHQARTLLWCHALNQPAVHRKVPLAKDSSLAAPPLDKALLHNCLVFVVNKVNSLHCMAERLGFEPRLEFPLNTLSKRAPSATRPSLRTTSRLIEFTTLNRLYPSR